MGTKWERESRESRETCSAEPMDVCLLLGHSLQCLTKWRGS